MEDEGIVDGSLLNPVNLTHGIGIFTVSGESVNSFSGQGDYFALFEELDDRFSAFVTWFEGMHDFTSGSTTQLPTRILSCLNGLECCQSVTTTFDDFRNMTLLLGSQSSVFTGKNLARSSGITFQQLRIHEG